MRAAVVHLLGLAIAAFSQGVAAGSVINVTLQDSVDGGFQGKNVTLDDPSRTLSIPVRSTRLTGPSGSLDGGFNLILWMASPGSSGPVGVSVGGDLRGSYSANDPALPDRLGGSVSGVGTGASLLPHQGPATVPPYLADLLEHPERVRFSGFVTGGAGNILETTLTIAPPVDPHAMYPAPEPSMLAVLLMAMAGVPIAHRLRSR